MEKTTRPDDLNMDDIRRITGVPKGSPNSFNKIKKTLDDAGIYYWLKADGTFCTTLHHVHNAGLPEQQLAAKHKPKHNIQAVK